MRKDPVTQETYEEVLRRDAEEVWLRSEDLIHHGVSYRKFWTRRIICVAPTLDHSQSGTCWGRSTLEHVRKFAGMGARRAPSDKQHLVTLCWHHHLDGWATSHKVEEREYLESIYGEMDPDNARTLLE